MQHVDKLTRHTGATSPDAVLDQTGLLTSPVQVPSWFVCVFVKTIFSYRRFVCFFSVLYVIISWHALTAFVSLFLFRLFCSTSVGNSNNSSGMQFKMSR